MGTNIPERQELQGSPALEKACSHASPAGAQSLEQRRGKEQLVENYKVAFWKSQSEFSIGARLCTESYICVPDAPEHGSVQLLLPFHLTPERKKASSFLKQLFSLPRSPAPSREMEP